MRFPSVDDGWLLLIAKLQLKKNQEPEDANRLRGVHSVGGDPLLAAALGRGGLALTSLRHFAGDLLMIHFEWRQKRGEWQIKGFWIVKTPVVSLHLNPRLFPG